MGLFVIGLTAALGYSIKMAMLTTPDHILTHSPWIVACVPLAILWGPVVFGYLSAIGGNEFRR